MVMNEKVQLGWKIPKSVLEKFRVYCVEVGSNYQDTTAAAMVVWPYLPAEVQRRAQLEASGKSQKKFWDLFSSGLEDAMHKLSLDPSHSPKDKRR